MTLRSLPIEFRFPIPIMLGVEYMMFIFFSLKGFKMYTFTISARDIFFSKYEMKKVEMTFKDDKGIEGQYLIETVEIEGLTGIAPYADLFVFQNISAIDCLKLFNICEENSWDYDMFES